MIKFKDKIRFLTLMFLGLMITISCETDETQQVTTFNNLVFADEFDVNGAPNPEVWAFDLGTGSNGWGNNELQNYTNRPENVIVQNGYLIITARQEQYQGSAFTSARIKTQNLFSQKYGRFEARVKLPLGKGLWPAFWMLGSNFDQVGWPQCGEIDIMEYLGNKPTEVFGTIHGPGFAGAESISKFYSLPTGRFDTDFHVFGVEWTESYINWYVDDVLYSQKTRKQVEQEGGEWVFNNDFFMILNIAVGGNLPGSPDANTMFPQRMLVDYVRVYN